MRDKLQNIKLLLMFIIGLGVGIYYRLVFNDSIVIGVMIGLLLSYIAMIGVVKEIEKEKEL